MNKKILGVSLASTFVVTFVVFQNFVYQLDRDACPTVNEIDIATVPENENFRNDNDKNLIPEPPSLMWDLRMNSDIQHVTAIDGEPCNSKKESTDYKQLHYRPHLPPQRTTVDGRVVLPMASNKFGLNIPEKLESEFLKSEDGSTITRDPIRLQDENLNVVDEMAMHDWKGLYVDQNGKWQKKALKLRNHHTTICDGTEMFKKDGVPQRFNPYKCGLNDCYRLTLITPYKIPRDGIVKNNEINISGTTITKESGKVIMDLKHAFDEDGEAFHKKTNDFFSDQQSQNYDIEFWSVEVDVVVSAPKTKDAQIVSAKIVPNTMNKSRKYPFQLVKEPMFTEDGRLMLLRIGEGKGARKFIWDKTKKKLVEKRDGTGKGRDIVYIATPKEKNPCDVTSWREFYPVTYAHSDPMIMGRYGFAEYPFRDSEGNIIPEGEDIGGTYPWIDRKGANIFFASMSADLTKAYVDGPLKGQLKENSARFPYDCEDEKNCEKIDFEWRNQGAKGFSVAGLWTHGKTVFLDGLINHIDFGIKRPAENHKRLYLYKHHVTENGQKIEKAVGVTIGNGREPKGDEGVDTVPTGSVANLNLLDSTENLFNYLPNMKPQSFRDVVWLMNSGASSSEVVFDDYLNVDALIVSSMNASMKYSSAEGMMYQDGFILKDFDKQVKSGEVHIQNAATSPHWDLPAYGLVTNGRVEPVAQGGVHGRGFWLSGTKSNITYSIPSSGNNSSIPSQSFYFGLFIDPRFPSDTTIRKLVSFSNGGYIALNGLSKLVIKDASVPSVQSYLYPTSSTKLPFGKWSHLGFLVKPIQNEMELYYNGYLFQKVQFTQKITPGGHISLGNGFRGWIDDFKVFVLKNSKSMSPELLCNESRGTLIGIDFKGAGPEYSYWKNVAMAFEKVSNVGRSVINGKLVKMSKNTHPLYACYVDYNSELGAVKFKLDDLIRTSGNKISSIRDDLLFPEASSESRLVYGRERPISTTNNFCLSCHANGLPETLSLNALMPTSGEVMQNDPRRQPMQPPRLMFGNPHSLFKSVENDSEIVMESRGRIFEGAYQVRDTTSSRTGLYVDQWDFQETEGP